MKNVGNSCYINAVLQALLGLPTFVAALQDERLTGAKHKGMERSLHVDSVCQLLFNMALERFGGNSQPIDTKQIKDVLGKRNRVFSGYRQQVRKRVQ